MTWFLSVLSQLAIPLIICALVTFGALYWLDRRTRQLEDNEHDPGDIF